MPNDLVSREAVLKALRARGRELLKLGTSFESNIASVTALECVNIVKDAPAVDAAPVVRCKECKHYSDGVCEQIAYIMDGYYRGTFEEKRHDDFCSYGEKKDGGK